MLLSWGPPFTFGYNLRPGLSFPMCTCWAQSCYCRRWRGRPSRWASQSSARCLPPSRSSPRSPWQTLRPRLAWWQGSPHIVMLLTQAVGMKSLQAAERPADLAPIRFNCWQSTVLNELRAEQTREFQNCNDSEGWLTPHAPWKWKF